jgi:ABC-type antimicrobial peptide transport system permease subunit
MRLAMGARSGQLMLMVVGRGAALGSVGVAVGLALALVLTRLMTALLFGVSPADPATYATVAGGLLAVAVLASYLPAKRAARVDPAVALRAE